MLNKNNVWKMVGVLFFCVIFISCSVSAGFNNSFKRQSVTLLSGDVFYVGGNGSNNYTRIQDAIDNASSGDTIFVFDDSSPYHENIIINKSIFLIGEDKNLVVIDGDFKDMVITITTDDVFVSGFTMIHPHTSHNDWDSALVDIISSENVTIKDSIMHQYEVHYGANNAGIILRNSSYCFIQNNTVITEPDTMKAYGIVLLPSSNFNNISGNEINNYVGGVLIWSSSDNVIYMNYIHHNLDSIWINFGNNNTIINNIVNFNAGEGIRIDDGYNNVIFRNIISDNGEGGDIQRGIGLIGGSDNYISYNQISNNNPSGIFLLSPNNIITQNNISNNKIGVFFYTSYKNYIIKNNFILNKKNGYFDRFISIRDRMIWNENYWNRPRFMPYPIFGIGHLPLLSFRWVVFDWHPAKEPYEI